MTIPGIYKDAKLLRLTSPGNDPSATSGTTLGNATITDDGQWSGTWENLPIDSDGKTTVTVPATSAAIVKLTK